MHDVICTAGFELSRLITGWTARVTLVTDGAAELSDEQRGILAERGIDVREERVQAAAVEGHDVRGIVLGSGECLPCGAVYLKPAQRIRGPLPDALGLARTEDNLIRTDDAGRTSVLVVYACGDAVTSRQMVQAAAATGALTAAMLNHDLVADGLR